MNAPVAALANPALQATPPAADALAITLDDVRRAQAQLAGQVLRTPLVPALNLSRELGAEIVVKHENMQATSSFKARGAYVKFASLDDAERRRGVVAMSAGNHAQAVAYHAARLGIPATIVMPERTPMVKVENTRRHGARVMLVGETLSDSEAEARRLAREDGLVLVHPYDDALVMAGQGTVGLEMIEERPDLDVIVVPIGGGGLCAGVAVAARGLKPELEIVGVEAALYPSVANALEGRDAPVGGLTLAEGIAVKAVGRLTLPVIRALVSRVALVEEALIEKAVAAFAEQERTMAEGAGAAGLAALFAEPDAYRGRKVGLILCGGNIDARLLASVILRELERGERIVTWRMRGADGPGVLGRIATAIARCGGNILEVAHGRLDLDLPAKAVTIDVTVETKDAAHTRDIAAVLAEGGLQPQRIGGSLGKERAF